MSEVVTQMQAAVDLRVAVVAYERRPTIRQMRRVDQARRVARREGVDVDRVERNARRSV